MNRFTRVTFQLFCSMFQMVWFTGKKSKKLANRSTIRGFVLITGLARLILKSLPTLCWLTPLTRTSVSGCQYHAGYPSRETQWEATLQLRYTGSYLQLFSSIFFSKHCCYFTACYQLHLFLDPFATRFPPPPPSRSIFPALDFVCCLWSWLFALW